MANVTFTDEEHLEVTSAELVYRRHSVISFESLTTPGILLLAPAV
jgi:hypothetical protein